MSEFRQDLSDILFNEIEASERIVKETDYFVALNPFASHYPFETLIMLKVHSSCFGRILDIEINELARLMKEILLKIYLSKEF